MYRQFRANSTSHSLLTRSVYMLLAAMLVASAPAHARDDVLNFSIRNALNAPAAHEKLNPNIHLYFAGEEIPYVSHQFGEYRTNKKTNAFNKSDLDACNWVFLTAILQLQSRAEQLGANAVVNIRSNYKNQVFADPHDFQCGAGNVIAGVALIGDAVTIN